MFNDSMRRPLLPPIPSTSSQISLMRTTKVNSILFLELLNAQRPIGSGTPASSIPVKSSASKLVGAAPPNWKSKASSIKNQGSCGACWAFTTVGVYETFLMVKGKPEEDLSEEFILECTNTLHPTNYVSDCTGGYTDFSFEVVKSYGIPK